MVQPENLSFGPFEFQPGIGRLTKLGYSVKLQRKAAIILSCLLERRGEVVSRAQLQERLWPAGIYVDFELGIKVAMNKLRDALGDLSEDPVYIQTVYGEGYRFIAPVVPVAHSDDDTAPVPQPKAPGAIRRKIRWAGAIASVAAAATLALFLVRAASITPLHFQNRDWVVIAAFENPTGENVLDGSMEYALERELSLSSYVNVAPRERIGDTLKLMRQSPTVVLNEDLARQVAIRDGGIKAVLAGRVEKFGQKYVLTVRVLNPSGGETVAVFKKEGSQDQLADRAGSIAGEIRRRLGERGLDGGAAQAARLEKATTPSLTALRAFSQGMRNVNGFKWEAAAGLLQEAIREDPQFALAHIYAAHCYSNLGKDGLAAPHYEAAFQLAPGVSQRERLFILGSYYSRFLHDDRRALASYEALTNLYPDDYWGLNNLVGTYDNLGMHREGMEAARRLLAIRPTEAHTLLGEVQVANLDLETASDRWRNADVNGAAQEVVRVSAHAMAQANDGYAFHLAMANNTLGRVGAAKELCGHMGDLGLRRQCLLRVAYVGGDRDLAKELLSQLRTTRPPDEFLFVDVVVALWSGEIATAKQWAQLLRPTRPEVDGLILRAEGHPKEATDKLSNITSEVVNFYTLCIRLALASALETQGKIEEAIAKLEADTRPSLVDLRFGWPWLQCRVKLAELYRKAGREKDALRTEDELRLYLSEADPDHPVASRLRALHASR